MLRIAGLFALVACWILPVGPAAAQSNQNALDEVLEVSEQPSFIFRAIQSSRPEDSACLNEGANVSLAKELINVRSGIVVVSIGEGEGIMPDEEWTDFSPALPWRKNIDRHLMFNDDCFYRSPDAPIDCKGDECRIMQTYGDYEWTALSAVVSQDCLPIGEGVCGQSGVEPGSISVTVTRKCHELAFENEIHELVDPSGNRYVMHATATGTPDLNAALPEGWTLDRVALEEPLVVLPFGDGSKCYHNVMRDNLGQGYHQYIFAGETYP